MRAGYGWGWPARTRCRAAAADLLALADGAAVLVQRQHQGIELLIGGVRDPEFGAMIAAGFGGVLVEAQRDVQLAVAPVDAGQATAMLRALRGAAVFGGLRGSAPVDLGPVAALIAAVSELMADNPRDRRTGPEPRAGQRGRVHGRGLADPGRLTRDPVRSAGHCGRAG